MICWFSLIDEEEEQEKEEGDDDDDDGGRDDAVVGHTGMQRVWARTRCRFIGCWNKLT